MVPEKKVHLHFLKALSRAKSEDRVTLSKYLNDKGVDALGQYVFQLAHTSLPMKKGGKKKLKEHFENHQKDLKTLMKKDAPLGKRQASLSRLSSADGALTPLLKIGLPYLESRTYSPAKSQSKKKTSCEKRKPSNPVTKPSA